MKRYVVRDCDPPSGTVAFVSEEGCFLSALRSELSNYNLRVEVEQ